MGDAAQVANAMRMFGLKKWAKTELYVRQFSNQAEDRMRGEVRAAGWGPDTGTLDSAIRSEEKSLGVFNLEVTTMIESNVNPDTGFTADVYGGHINDGHFNVFLKQSIPPVQFMETGSLSAFGELMGKLSGLWGGP